MKAMPATAAPDESPARGPNVHRRMAIALIAGHAIATPLVLRMAPLEINVALVRRTECVPHGIEAELRVLPTVRFGRCICVSC